MVQTNKKFVMLFRTQLVGEVPCPYPMVKVPEHDMGIKKAFAILVDHHTEKLAWGIVFRFFPDYASLCVYNEDFFTARGLEPSVKNVLQFANS